jgi:hypothetical protein
MVVSLPDMSGWFLMPHHQVFELEEQIMIFAQVEPPLSPAKVKLSDLTAAHVVCILIFTT